MGKLTRNSKQPTSFQDELTMLINRFCEEGDSNTPDYVLAKYLVGCLNTFNEAVIERERWYGRSDYIKHS